MDASRGTRTGIVGIEEVAIVTVTIVVETETTAAGIGTGIIEGATVTTIVTETRESVTRGITSTVAHTVVPLYTFEQAKGVPGGVLLVKERLQGFAKIALEVVSQLLNQILWLKGGEHLQ